MEKTNEMNVGRYTMLSLGLILAVYVGFGLHWGISKPLSGSITWGMLLGVVTGLVIFGVSAYFCLVEPKAMSFLNETEGELRKVVWPKSTPVSPSTELWQYTIAVVALMLVLIVYISIVDSAIDVVLKYFIL
jgi:preprotein translocase SecE subunit